MSQDTPQDHISKKRVVYTMPGVDAVTVRRDEAYRVTEAGALTLDLYYPPDAKSGARIPAVVFVTGFSDVGARQMLGCQLKDMGAYVSWGQLAAASGLVAITYTNREPATDVHAVLEYVRQHAKPLNVDEQRIGVWAGSGNVPNALAVLMQPAQPALKCAVLCYGYMLDLDGSTAVAEAARQWGFVNPCAGKSVEDLPRDLPLFIARAGRDQPRLNEGIDRFVAKALTGNLPITLVNYPRPRTRSTCSTTARPHARSSGEFWRSSNFTSGHSCGGVPRAVDRAFDEYNRLVGSRHAKANSSDADAFARAMAEENVVRLPDSRRRARAAPAVSLPPVKAPSGEATDDSGEDFAAPGVDRREIRKLKGGDFVAGDRLDLHGMTTAAASASVKQFLERSRHRRHRCVCIVHGRGLRSPNGVAVLKASVRQYLRSHRSVLAYADAPRTDGGAGAVYVLLRRQA